MSDEWWGLIYFILAISIPIGLAVLITYLLPKCKHAHTQTSSWDFACSMTWCLDCGKELHQGKWR